MKIIWASKLMSFPIKIKLTNAPNNVAKLQIP